jgi:hypothetical protein
MAQDPEVPRISGMFTVSIACPRTCKLQIQHAPGLHVCLTSHLVFEACEETACTVYLLPAKSGGARIGSGLVSCQSCLGLPAAAWMQRPAGLCCKHCTMRCRMRLGLSGLHAGPGLTISSQGDGKLFFLSCERVPSEVVATMLRAMQHGDANGSITLPFSRSELAAWMVQANKATPKATTAAADSDDGSDCGTLNGWDSDDDNNNNASTWQPIVTTLKVRSCHVLRLRSCVHYLTNSVVIDCRSTQRSSFVRCPRLTCDARVLLARTSSSHACCPAGRGSHARHGHAPCAGRAAGAVLPPQGLVRRSR